MFKNTTIKIHDGDCVAMICPNDRRFSGKNLVRYLSELSELNFKKIVMLVANGTLEASSMQSKNTSKDFDVLVEESKNKTKIWKEKEEEIIKKYTNVTLAEWDDLIFSNPFFEKTKEEVIKKYNEDKEFQCEIKKSINYFLKSRYKGRNFSESEPEWISCFNYKINEVTGVMIKKNLGFKFLAYPGSLCPGLKYAVEKIVNKESISLAFIKIELKRKKEKQSNSVKVGFFGTENDSTALRILDLELKNCKTPQEGMMLLTKIQSLALKYMTEYSSINSLSSDKVKQEASQDGGIIFK